MLMCMLALSSSCFSFWKRHQSLNFSPCFYPSGKKKHYKGKMRAVARRKRLWEKGGNLTRVSMCLWEFFFVFLFVRDAIFGSPKHRFSREIFFFGGFSSWKCRASRRAPFCPSQTHPFSFFLPPYLLSSIILLWKHIHTEGNLEIYSKISSSQRREASVGRVEEENPPLEERNREFEQKQHTKMRELRIEMKKKNV